MEIFITDTITCESIISELNILRTNPEEESKFFEYVDETQNQKNQKKFEYNAGENLKILCQENKVKIEYYETKPPHFRYILSEQLDNIFSKLNAFSSIDISKIVKTSWFCILWTPFKSPKINFSNTSFLVYYQFSYSENELSFRGYNNYSEFPVVGILPLKFEEQLWLQRISKSKIIFLFLVNVPGSLNLNYASEMINFKMALNDSVV